MLKIKNKHCTSVNKNKILKIKTRTHACVTGVDTKYLYIIIKVGKEKSHQMRLPNIYLNNATSLCKANVAFFYFI